MTKVAKTESSIKSAPRSRTITVSKIKLEAVAKPKAPDQGIAGMPSRYGIAIHALLAGKSMTAAAKEAGLNRQYLHVLRKSHLGFQAAYRAEQEYMMEANRAAMVVAAQISIRAMTRKVEDESVADSVQVRAAEVILKTTERMGLFNAVPGQTIDHRLDIHHAAMTQAPEIKQDIESYRAEAEQAFELSDHGQELAMAQTRYAELEADESELREQFYAHEEAAEASTSEGLRADLEQLCSDIESRLDEIEIESNTLYTRIDELKQLRSLYVDQGCGVYEPLDKDDVPIHGLVESPTLDIHKDMMKNGFPWRNEIGR